MNRRTAAWLASVLIVLQMVLGPVAHPMTGAVGAVHCTHAAGSAACGGGDCGNCPSGSDHAPGPHHGHDGATSHARCSCPCAHTPALSIASFTLARPDVPVALACEPKGPAFSPPLFDFLRPPN